MRFEYWKSSLDHLWYWQLRTAGHEKLAQGEPCATRAACLRAIELVRQSGGATVHDLSPREK